MCRICDQDLLPILSIHLLQLGNQLLEDYEKTYQQMPWLSRETEEEIDGIIKLQEQQGGEEDDKRARTGTLGKLRKGTLSKKQHETVSVAVYFKTLLHGGQKYFVHCDCSKKYDN